MLYFAAYFETKMWQIHCYIEVSVIYEAYTAVLMKQLVVQHKHMLVLKAFSNSFYIIYLIPLSKLSECIKMWNIKTLNILLVSLNNNVSKQNMSFVQFDYQMFIFVFFNF